MTLMIPFVLLEQQNFCIALGKAVALHDILNADLIRRIDKSPEELDIFAVL